MHAELGSKIWAEFVKTRDNPPSWMRLFGSFPVANQLCAGDGGTFACHVKEKVKKGNWSLYSLPLEKTNVGVILALRDGSEPIVWDFAGGIMIERNG